MQKPKNPIRAVFLNIVLPGLGCAYLGRWGYALLFLVWTPLRWAAGTVLIGYLPLHAMPGYWGTIVRAILIYLWWAVVLYDICTTPYRLAEEYNQGLESRLRQTGEMAVG